jgi:hypothetical protein
MTSGLDCTLHHQLVLDNREIRERFPEETGDVCLVLRVYKYVSRAYSAS